LAAQPHVWAPHVEPASFPNTESSESRTENRRVFPSDNLDSVNGVDERSLLDQLAHAHSRTRPRATRPAWKPARVDQILPRLPHRFTAHAAVAALVLAVIAGSGFPALALDMDWTRGTAATATDHVAMEPDGHDGHADEQPDTRPILVMARSQADRQAVKDTLSPSLLRHAAPAPSPWIAIHQVAAGETLGVIAARYQVSALALLGANQLAPETLAVGQKLRIPLRPGVAHTVLAEDTVESIAERFGVATTTVRYFAPNRLANNRPLVPGEEIFVPGGHLAIGNGPAGPTELAAAQLTAELIGAVADDETNLRGGPGTDYPKIVQLSRAATVKLQLRHEEWFNVETVNGTRGWVSSDLLDMPEGVADQVPVAPNIPPPPVAVAAQVAPAAPVPSPAAVVEQPKPAAPVLKSKALLPPAAPAPKAVVSPPIVPKPAARKASNRWVWPTRGDITSGFGYRKLRVGRYHNGLDIANRKWTPIVAARGGTVKQAGWCSGYGYCVVINHHDGFVTEYGHMASKPPVRAGQGVLPGQLIGYMGMSYDRRGGGYATGVHLHFTVRRNGVAVNPRKYLP